MAPYPSRAKDVFVGIDIFGRGQVGQLDTHKTFQRIPDELSVALFATGWTLESIEVQMKHEGRPVWTQELNTRFLERDRQLWGSLWPFLVVYGPNRLPFYTSFCIGSGKFSNRLGMRVKRKSWFDLRKQELQPCNPSIERCFDDSFDGGSCLSFGKADGVKSHLLFECDFDIVRDVLVSIAYKRNHHSIDINLDLLLKPSATQKRFRWTLVPKHYSNDNAVVRELIDNLQKRGDRHLPYVNSINGWEVR